MEETRQHPPVDNGPQRRLRGFLWHLAAYLAVSAAVFVWNAAAAVATPWFLLPVVGWGAILALHVAYVMGLFDVFQRK